jgi:lipopolysaccharide assembly protein A
MKLLFWVGVAVAAAVFGTFAASNRESVALALWPLPVVADLPLYIAVLGALLIGVILGAVATWTAGAGRRRQSRRRARRIAQLERELSLANVQPPAVAERASALVARD